MRAVSRLFCALTLAAGTVGIGGCSSSLEPLDTEGTLIEVQYVNFAWTPTWKGIVIDSTGAVHSYDLNGRQWAVADAEHPTERELAAKYASGRELIRNLPAAEVSQFFALARQAADGSVTQPVPRCADAGFLTYSVYRSTGGNRTERLLLRAEGDMIRENRAPAARELARKLSEIGVFTPIEGCQPDA